MRNRGAFKALCLVFLMLIKSMVAKPLYSNGLYQDWDPQTNKLIYCGNVLVKRGFESVRCTKNETEDSVRKCPTGQYQPDETNSSSSPQCIAEPQCTDEGLRKDLKCIDDYCWTVCICSLEDGKCGLDPSNCLDIKDRCTGKVLQNCSCAPSVIATALPTSPPTRSNFSTIFKPINPDLTAQTLLLIPTDKPWTDTTKNTDMTDVTKNGTDIGAIEMRSFLPIIISSSILIILVVSYLCVKFCKHGSNKPIEGLKEESIEMLGSVPADGNNGLDKVSETTDSGVCGLSQGSNEKHEHGEDDPNSINLCNGSNMEGGRNLDITVEDESDQEVARGQSSCQVEVHKDSKLREELTLAEEDDSCQESDQLLNEFTDDPSVRDLSQQSDVNSESGETIPMNNMVNEPDDPDATHCKSTSISYSGTNLHNADGNGAGHHITDLDPALSLCQLEAQKEPTHREKPTIVVEMEDDSLEKASLQEKKVAVVSPFMNEAQTIPVQVLPPANAETQQLRGEGYPSGSRFSSGGATSNVSSNWNSFTSSINNDSTNQTG